MLYVSTRRELSNENQIGPTSFWDLDVQGYVENVDGRKELELNDFLDSLQGKSILMLVHGYNNELEDIIRAYDMVRERVDRYLDDWYDDVVGFTWPGGDSPLDWYAPKRRAGAVAPRLAQLISLIGPRVECVDLMSHSLGARVALGALNATRAGAVRANFLTASAVDNEVLEVGEKYFAAAKSGASESVVFHSKRDGVLSTAYRLAEWDRPLGLLGPEDPGSIIAHLPNVFVANCKNVISGHGDYKTSGPIFEFIGEWMRGGIKTQFSTL